MSGNSDLNLIQSDLQDWTVLFVHKRKHSQMWSPYLRHFVFVFTDHFVHSLYFLQQVYSNKTKVYSSLCD